jgi:diphosphoinositol-polyphosphate diphosphatase
MTQATRTTSGIVMFNEDVTKVYLVTSLKLAGKWVFPKGGLEEGLTPEENAAKEMREEAGIAVTVGEKIFDADAHYPEYEGNPPRVQREIYFLGTFLSYVEWEEFEKRKREWHPIDSTLAEKLTSVQVDVLAHALVAARKALKAQSAEAAVTP